ncbi:NAD(P)-dependent alcohol dehydrogenase [Agromyces cerinus subsp. nitratus]|uniref:NAD(P)-dependent alcohol dehydrogenase n=1 Tax=Agromyces cerinus TaxID=33878 RepID=UPI003638A7E2
MRIAVYERYGPPEVLHLQEAAEPTIDASEVLVRVEASTVGPSDSAGRSGTPRFARLFFGLTKPKHPVLGSDFAGVVERVGSDVTRFAPGDRVFGTLAPSMGAHAELVVIAEDDRSRTSPQGSTPQGRSRRSTGSSPHCPSSAISPGWRPARSCSSTGRPARWARRRCSSRSTSVRRSSACAAPRTHRSSPRSGADRVIDYTREDFTEARGAYDVIFDAVGKRSFGAARRALAPHGIYLTTVPSAAIMVQWPLTRWFSHGRRAAIAFTGLRDIRLKAAELALLVELIDAGAFVPVVDRVVPFDDIADAHRRVDTGHKAGSVVVAMAPAASASSPAPSPKPVAA